MKREIKFRVWSKKRKYFLPINEDHDYLISASEAGLILIDNGDSINSNDLVWQQFTGLKDKKGKEIYEGDIVEFFSGDNFTVEFIESYAQFMISKNGELFNITTQELIIGNIFENPELIDFNITE